MDVNKKRGRPKSKLTLERERQEKMFSEIRKAHPLTKEQKEFYETMEINGEEVRKQILKDFKTHKIIPDDHAYTMASLGDDSLIGYENQIIADDNYYQQKIKESTARGGEILSLEADKRALTVWDKNRDLLARMNRATNKLTLNGATGIILDNWDKRGDGSKKPSENSIKNWYHRLISKKSPKA
jgi:hypothetical protein